MQQNNQIPNHSKPPIGYHSLQYLESLRLSYRDVVNEIEKTSELTRFSNSEISRRMTNLREYRAQIESEFNYLSSLVEEWVSQFPKKDAEIGELILNYYCDLLNEESLRYLIAEMMEIDTDCDDNIEKINAIPVQKYQSRMRVIALNLVKKK